MQPGGRTPRLTNMQKWIHMNMNARRECTRIGYSSHLELGKLLSLVAGIFCINELGEEEFVELEALGKTNTERDDWRY